MIAAGLDFTMGLKENGTVVATDDDEYGKTDLKAWKDMKSVAAGAHVSAGLRSDGTVIAVGIVGKIPLQ